MRYEEYNMYYNISNDWTDDDNDDKEEFLL